MLLDTLCGFTTVRNGSTIYVIGSGLTPLTDYYMYSETGVLTQDAFIQTVHTDANGTFVFTLARSNIAGTTYWIHSVLDNTPGNTEWRIANPVTLAWNSTAPIPVYVSSNPVLTVKPKNSRAKLSWVPPTVCDPRSNFRYSVNRTPPGTPPIASGLTVLAYDDEPLVNGTSYSWFVRGRFFVVSLDTGQNFDSNSVSVIPKVFEAWGIVAA